MRDICARAGANVAAINYHFGGKEGLYRAVLADAGRQALERHPIGGGAAPDAPPEERLRAFINNYLARLLDGGSTAWHGRLIARELVEPTAALDDLAREFVQPQYASLRQIVSDLLGPGHTEDTLRLCCCSVVGQCLFYKHCRPMIERVAPEQGYDGAARDALADHIFRFSLSAIRAMGAPR